MTLSQLSALAAAATPGPWRTEFDGVHVDHTVFSDTPDDNTAVATTWGVAHGVTPEQAQADAAFIAACSPDVIAALVRAAEASRSVLIWYQRCLDAAVGRGADPMYLREAEVATDLRDALSALESVGR